MALDSTASTIDGTVAFEPDVPLPELQAGDYVLGLPEPDKTDRTLHLVVQAFGEHKVPFEEPPSWFRRTFLAGRRYPGVLVRTVGPDTLAMFVQESTPTVDRVTGRA